MQGGYGMRFCTVPIDEQDLDVTIQLFRWVCPDKWAGFVISR